MPNQLNKLLVRFLVFILPPVIVVIFFILVQAILLLFKNGTISEIPVFLAPVFLILPLAFIFASNFRFRFLFVIPLIFSVSIFFKDPATATKIILLTNLLAIFPWYHKRQLSFDKLALFSAALYFCYLSVLSIAQMSSFSSQWTLDFATYNNAMWNFSHLRNFFHSDFIDTTYGSHSTIFGHSSFIIIPMALVFRLFPRPETLLVLQSISISGSIYISYLLSYQFLRDKKYSALLSLSLLFYPQLLWIGLSDFRPETFSVFFLFLCLYFVSTKPFKSSIFLLTALVSSEINALYAISIAAYLMIQKKWKQGIIFALIGVIYLPVLYLFLYPLLTGPVAAATVTDQYGYFMGLVRPLNDLSYLKLSRISYFIFEPLKMSFFYRFFDPFLRLPIINPIFWLIGAPGIFRLLLLNVSLRNFYEPTLFYYFSSLIPVLFFTNLLVLKRFGTFVRYAVILSILVLSVISFYNENRSPVGLYSRLSTFVISPRDKLAYQAMKLVPSQASILVSQKYLVPFSSRPKVDIFYRFSLESIKDFDYFLVDTVGNMRETDEDERQIAKMDKNVIVDKFIAETHQLLPGQHLEIIYNRDGLVLFKK